ncbi:MAG: hypothetical protein ABIH27_07170 [Candidatus Omnitrophota bacterium]
MIINKKGMTILEIVISMLIISFVSIGIANVFIAAKKHISKNRSKIIAAELGRYYMDILKVNVTQGTWDQPGNDLNLTNTMFNNNMNPLMNYTIWRNVTYANDTLLNNNVRGVRLTISWNETF